MVRSDGYEMTLNFLEFNYLTGTELASSSFINKRQLDAPGRHLNRNAPPRRPAHSRRPRENHEQAGFKRARAVIRCFKVATSQVGIRNKHLTRLEPVHLECQLVVTSGV